MQRLKKHWLLLTTLLLLRIQRHNLKRTLLWRPFIIDLWDTRLPRWLPRHYEFSIPADNRADRVEVSINYHLLDERRRKRIGYNNTTPIDYEIFHRQILLNGDKDE